MWFSFSSWRSFSLNRDSLKTVNIFLGFFLIINYCLGSGYLGIPYAFFYSGYLAAVPTTLFIALVNWVNANYLLEVMARAQALEHLNASEEPTDEASHQDSIHLMTADHQPSQTHHPNYELTLNRKFEVSELIVIFFNKYVRYIFTAILSLYGFLVNWSYATIAGSAWAINIPFHHFGAAEICADDAFLHRTIPTGGCLYAYYIALTMFAIVVVPVSLFNLREQTIVQVVMGLLRFVTLAVIIGYCIFRLAGDGDACWDELRLTNTTTPINVGATSMVWEFNVKGWLVAIPVIVNAFLFHPGISSLTHPVKQKQYHHWLVASVFVVSVMSYLALGIVVPLWFRLATQETCTLSWAVFSEPGHQFSYKLLSYYIVLFPAIDVISSYPLMNHVMSNNLYSLIAGQDSSKTPKYRFDWLLKVTLRFVAALLPILAAFGVANLIYVFRYAGLFGFLNLFSPILLQLRSIYVCKKKFSMLDSISLEGDSVMNQSNLENKFSSEQESREQSFTNSHQSCHQSYSKSVHSASNHSSGLGKQLSDSGWSVQEDGSSSKKERASYRSDKGKELHQDKEKRSSDNDRDSYSDSGRELRQPMLEEEQGGSSIKERASYRSLCSNMGEELHQDEEKRSSESERESYSDSERELRQSMLKEEEREEEKAEKGKRAKKKTPLTYMTPYSFVVLSHPVFVCVVGVLGVILLVLAIASLFLQLEDLTCVALSSSLEL